MRENKSASIKSFSNPVVFLAAENHHREKINNTSSENTKRTCETWQLKLSSGGGTYGIHPPVVVVFERHRSFRPKNIPIQRVCVCSLLSLSLFESFFLGVRSALFIESLKEEIFFSHKFFFQNFFQDQNVFLHEMFPCIK